MSSIFDHIPEAPADPILNTAAQFKKDTHAKKVNLGIGAYRCDDGKPVILESVREAELEIANDKNENKEYSPIDGNPELKLLTQKLLLGDKSPAIAEGRIASSQALSGTGSLRVAGEFIKQHMPKENHIIYLPKPTWGNHTAIFQKAGLEVRGYPYWDAEKKNFNCTGMLEELRKAPAGASVLLHSVAHNPTGIDPTPEQWSSILATMKTHKLFPVVDNAYQGFASGDLDKDAHSTRLLDKDFDMEFMICQSFAKNLGLYGERIGMLHVICKNKKAASAVLSQVKGVIRPMYSSPPIHGAQLVVRILGKPERRKKWANEVKHMADRINTMRVALRKELESLNTPGTWNHITDQIGMFSFTGLSADQCTQLIEKYHIYLLKSGRISMAGVNTKNVKYIAESMNAVLTNKVVLSSL